MLLAVPNVSEGRDRATIERLAGAFGGLRLLDVHSDPDHGRSVLTLAGEQADVAEGLLAGAREAVAAIDLRGHEGLHPHVGAIDVAPVVYLDPADRGAATAAALTTAALIGDELALPVFLYGALARGRERAEVRAGGLESLVERMRSCELVPDYGPHEPHPTAGAMLVTARPPLVAFNLDLDTDDVELAREIAAGLREAGGGPAGVRAIGLFLPARGRAQVSMNVHDPRAVPLAELVARVRERAPVAEAELVGLAPRAAFDGFPDDLPLRGFDPERHLIEEALASIDVVAQTKRKRKHRGTPAGTIEARGRTGRPPTASEVKKTAAERRQERLDRPPTWRGAMNRAAIAAVVFFVIAMLLLGQPPAVAAALALFAFALYVPSGYMIDKLIYDRRQKQKSKQKQR